MARAYLYYFQKKKNKKTLTPIKVDLFVQIKQMKYGVAANKIQKLLAPQLISRYAYYYTKIDPIWLLVHIGNINN